ncbi:MULTISPECIES: polyprenyl synthetase family protein [Micrococcaceae]|jgi:geranylgeranyl diphosphate synthase type II|uniref:Geranylgeranyl pyrophosphate synthase n=1 Tax=Paenarthrobacter aurescens (strain TC1) TaxID=290340 RepID=A1R1M5_PAEAT|nr:MULTISPECIES: polyprenyl synthetase family protein [Micrococcaceae]ABM08084.1 putative geranylgeranyl pyrophosphate synthase [Paenarthrobacter aurescens TC1]AFR27258.1 putative geranylgeranyl pyrophosphate synthase [Arthrobacter sp. Rue61a]MBP2267899.1 geranylgeranyl diphosphate synthase type II [Pseudarthrobacter sp. PvP004]
MTITSNAVRGRTDLCTAIENELSGLIDKRASAATAYGADFARLWALAGQNVLGGKFVRPLLLMETYDALHKHGPAEPHQRETAISIAAAIELLHYAFLLHDDVIDGDLVRRGHPNLIGSLLAEAGETARTDGADGARAGSGLHWAQTGGILMGDMLLAATHQAFARAELPHELRLRLLDLLEHTINETVAGEQLDVGLGDGIIAPDLQTILMMCGYKTATYTFELPLRAAATLAGADFAVENALATAGRHLGLAFQLQDDLLSTFGDPRRHGKDPFSDLREGKETAIIAHARTTTVWPDIEPFFGRPELSVGDGEHVRRHLSDCGAEVFVQGLIEEQLQAFNNQLTSTIPASVRNVLLDLAGQLEGRQS